MVFVAEKKKDFMKAAGIILIVIGILMFIFQGISFTKKEEVAQIGPVEINKKERESVGWPVYAGGVVIGAGVVLLIAGRKKRG
jgi:uncharacterized membrane protein HdeD (DUF308 family)